MTLSANSEKRETLSIRLMRSNALEKFVFAEKVRTPVDDLENLKHIIPCVIPFNCPNSDYSKPHYTMKNQSLPNEYDENVLVQFDRETLSGDRYQGIVSGLWGIETIRETDEFYTASNGEKIEKCGSIDPFDIPTSQLYNINSIYAPVKTETISKQTVFSV